MGIRSTGQEVIMNHPGVVLAAVGERTQNSAVQIAAQDEQDAVIGLQHFRRRRVPVRLCGEQRASCTVGKPSSNRARAVVERLGRLEAVHVPRRAGLRVLVGHGDRHVRAHVR